MKFFLKTFFVLLIIVVFTNTTFSSEQLINTGSLEIKEDNKKTIKELKQEIKTIDKQKIESDKELDELKKELLVKKFFKVNLTPIEKNKLNKLIKKYKKIKEDLNEEIILKSKNLEDTTELKKKLLVNEKDFYGKLIEYIDISKYNDYIEYIKQNIIIINKQSNLNSSSAQKEVIVQEKVDNIKEKIEEHNKKTNEDTIAILNEKINKILIKLTKKEKFQKLDNTGKIKLFDNLIKVVSKKLDSLKIKTNKSKTQEIIVENKNEILKNIEEFKIKTLK